MLEHFDGERPLEDVAEALLEAMAERYHELERDDVPQAGQRMTELVALLLKADERLPRPEYRGVLWRAWLAAKNRLT